MESLSLSPADRLRMLETNNNLIRERLSLLAQNLVDAHRQQHQHLRSLEEEIKELKASSSELKLTFNHLSQEVNQFARKDQLRVLEKYLDLWNPVKFITQKELEDALLYISSISVHELIEGAYLSLRPIENLQAIRNFVNVANVLDFNLDCAEISGKISADLTKKGEKIGDIDIILASIAITNNLAIITRNIRHFNKIQKLKLVEW